MCLYKQATDFMQTSIKNTSRFEGKMVELNWLRTQGVSPVLNDKVDLLDQAYVEHLNSLQLHPEKHKRKEIYFD